jgi:SH3 domain protein
MNFKVEDESVNAIWVTAVISALSIFSLSAQADQLFVSDKLVVSVYTQASQESDKLATLDSGDAVEAIEKAEGFTHVKLADGRDGWIKSSYLNAQTPAIVRLRELEKERAPANTVPPQTAEELRQLHEQNAALRSEVSTLKQAAASMHGRPASETQTQERPKILSTRVESSALLHALEWGAGITLGAGAIGFGLGYRSLAGRIQRKYGKLKIY